MNFRCLADDIIASMNFFMFTFFWLLGSVMIFCIPCNFCKIFAEGEFLRRKINSNPEEIAITSLPSDIHGAPPESLVVKLAEVIGNFSTLRKMALFWCTVVAEVCLTQYETSSLYII